MNTKSIEINYADHFAYGKLFGKSKLNLRIQALKRFAPQFIKITWALWREWGFRWRARCAANISDLPLANKLLQDGAVAIRLHDDDIKIIKDRAQIFIEKLEKHIRQIEPSKRTFSDRTLMIYKSDDPILYSSLDKFFHTYNIFNALELYRGRCMKFEGIALQISNEDDTDLYGRFSDVGFPDAKTSYMHFDSSLRWMKCLIYLTNVTEDNGPFSYVLGSNKIHMGLLGYLTRKTNDKSRLDRCDRQRRELFWSLPRFLQKKCEFGNDILDDSSQSQFLLSREKRFTSEDGNIFLVDIDGIHRGGRVKRGTRRMLQVTFRPV